MEKMKRYVECYVPITTCNLHCHYCYITKLKKWNEPQPPITHTPQEIRKALSVKRLGGKCLINLCGGGETLLYPGITDVIRELLEEGHFTFVVTNGLLSEKFDELISLPEELRKHIIFKFSYHFFELKRTNQMEIFFDNIKKVWDAGCSFTLEITPNDEVIKDIPEIMQVAREHVGALNHVTIAREDTDPKIPILSKLTDEEFYKTWKQFDSELLEFKSQIFGVKPEGFCYAGDWSVYVHLGSGEMTQCYAGHRLDNIYEHPDKPLHFMAIGKCCDVAHCYNGHAFLSLGDIPTMDTPTYASLRNRVTESGREWLNDEAKEFLGTKLSESNKEYSTLKQKITNYRNRHS